jgi:DNA-binding LacI/PurR family transcriptional regulator
MPTIKDVAQRAGVSTATVSCVNNDCQAVSPHICESVHRAMTDIGFRPNRIGRMLKTARSGTIGVVVPRLKNPIFADVVQSVQLSAEQRGYNTLLISSNYDPQRELAAVKTLLANRVEGLMLTVADETNSSALHLLRSNRVPFVLVFNPATMADCSTVTVDNERAAAVIVGELVKRGYRHIGMILGRIKYSDRSERRCAGYMAAMREAGLSPTPIFGVDFK